MHLFIAVKTGAIVAIEFTVKGVYFSIIGKSYAESSIPLLNDELVALGLFEMGQNVCVVTKSGEFSRLLLDEMIAWPPRLWVSSVVNPASVTIRQKESEFMIANADVGLIVIGFRIALNLAEGTIACSLNGRRIVQCYPPVSEICIPIPEGEIKRGGAYTISIVVGGASGVCMGELSVHCVSVKEFNKVREERLEDGDWIMEATDLFQCPRGVPDPDAKLVLLEKVARAFGGRNGSDEKIKELFGLLYGDLRISVFVRQMIAKLRDDRGKLAVHWAEAIKGLIEEGPPEAIAPAFWRDYALLPAELKRPFERKVWEKIAAGELELGAHAIISLF
jgi:hypothetical protein